MSRLNSDKLRLNLGKEASKCVLCGHENMVEAERCRNCCAPIEFSRCTFQSKGSANRPKLITALGPDDCGKTMFLGMLLDMLSRQRERADFTACDSGSIAMQQQTIGSLAQGEFPNATDIDPENWKWAHCRISRRTRRDPHELFIADVSGESLVHELEHPGTTPLFKGLFLRSFGVFVCLDAGEVSRGEKNQEFYAMRVINEMNEARSRQPKPKNRSKRSRSKSPVRQAAPIAIVLHKADECEVAFDDPANFVRTKTPNLWELCQGLPNAVDYFATSVVGQVGIRRTSNGRSALVPLRVEPRGIIEPFRWLLGQQTAG